MKLLVEQLIKDESDQVLLRSRLRAVARRMGFSSASRERMELVCNETTSNQLKFATGTGVIQLWESDEPRGLDLFVLDYGPGVNDLALAERDGYTTAGTMGKGLGAVRRLSDDSAFYTQSVRESAATGWHGMAVWARFHLDDAPASEWASDIGQYLRAYQDDCYNGDCLHVQPLRERVRWMHLDGLGHGKAAAEAVAPVRRMLLSGESLDVLLREIGHHLHGGRGAVGIVGEWDSSAGTVAVCGVGDLAAYHLRGNVRREMPLASGILGHAHRRADIQFAEMRPGDLCMSASDGMRRNWLLSTFPGLWELHPQMIAFFLGQVVSRGNDDRSLFIVREPMSQRERKHEFR
ncbi:ATP-binding protein [Acidihalobacter prosperus]|uniref:Histidine kinase/HSP90-like ATPase domain-containing protein n=1 Tax=Acidihalobacter prosperus TaxID=160660 RepID=A0A1A6C6H9_9GAMM|nr:ATP-binding protein [Acidihalobacter prosperus]OBS10169.1 hypothetical protein Thpro_021219 [Acidihalobacter prosperus]